MTKLMKEKLNNDRVMMTSLGYEIVDKIKEEGFPQQGIDLYICIDEDLDVQISLTKDEGDEDQAFKIDGYYLTEQMSKLEEEWNRHCGEHREEDWDIDEDASVDEVLFERVYLELENLVRN